MSSEADKTKTGATHRPYDDAFKRAAVAPWQSGVPARRVADGLGITTESLRAWRRQLGGAEAVPTTAGDGKLPAIAPTSQELQAEVRRLRAQLQSVTNQRDILKKPSGSSPAQTGAFRHDRGPGGDLSGVRPVRGLGRVTRGLLCLASTRSQRAGPTRGCQYASEAYREHLAAWKVTPSMSRRGNCYDNAAMESFWSTLKQELVHRRSFASRTEAAGEIFDYIETFYNREWLHSALGYLSPVEFENRNNLN